MRVLDGLNRPDQARSLRTARLTAAPTLDTAAPVDVECDGESDRRAARHLRDYSGRHKPQNLTPAAAPLCARTDRHESVDSLARRRQPDRAGLALAGRLGSPCPRCWRRRPARWPRWTNPPPIWTPGTRDKFVALLGAEQVKQDLAARALHGTQASPTGCALRTGDLSRLPDAVLYPRSHDDVLALLRVCAQAGIAVTLFGTGSGPGALPVRGDHAALVSYRPVRYVASGFGGRDVGPGTRPKPASSADELMRQLAAQGMTLKGEMDGSLGGYIARNALQSPGCRRAAGDTARRW